VTAPDSPVAEELVPALGYVRGLRPRSRESAVIVHVTGAGPLRRLTEPGFATWRRRHLTEGATVTDSAVAVYRSVMPHSGHYVVGPDGRCVQTVPEELAAQHVGAAGHQQYHRALWAAAYDWWTARWPGLQSPLALAGARLWEGGTCNGGSIGVELAWPYDLARTPPTDAQWSTLRRLIRSVCDRRAIPCDVTHVLGHSDAHPASRTARGQPWDPPPWWSPARVAELLHVPAWS
jgi:N-acetyl-anhydromuramyl-L-alanine amidase AmpD